MKPKNSLKINQVSKLVRSKRSTEARPASAKDLPENKLSLLSETKKCTKNESKAKSSDFNCELCSKKFTDHSNLHRHKKTHSKDKKPFKCTKCPATYTRKDHLKKHIFLSHNETGNVPDPEGAKTKHNCELCSYSTFRRNDLENHLLRKHVADKLYSCDMCSYSTNLKSSLEKHAVVMHVVDKQFQCQLCPRMFIDEAWVKRHVTKDHAPRFKCQLCPQTFPRLDKFQEHQNKHSGEQPFGCDLCPRKYSSSRGLVTHKRTVHAIESRQKEEAIIHKKSMQKGPQTKDLI